MCPSLTSFNYGEKVWMSRRSEPTSTCRRRSTDIKSNGLWRERSMCFLALRVSAHADSWSCAQHWSWHLKKGHSSFSESVLVHRGRARRHLDQPRHRRAVERNWPSNRKIRVLCFVVEVISIQILGCCWMVPTTAWSCAIKCIIFLKSWINTFNLTPENSQNQPESLSVEAISIQSCNAGDSAFTRKGFVWEPKEADLFLEYLLTCGRYTYIICWDKRLETEVCVTKGWNQ